MTEAVGQALMLALVLILPVSALVARRLPLGSTLKYVGAWIAIFVIGALIIANFT